MVGHAQKEVSKLEKFDLKDLNIIETSEEGTLASSFDLRLHILRFETSSSQSCIFSHIGRESGLQRPKRPKRSKGDKSTKDTEALRGAERDMQEMS